MSTISVRLLQMPVIQLDGSTVTFYLKKSDALFFYMCIEKSATRTHLASLLWGGQPEAAARKNLRNALYAIKQTFGFDPFESPKKQILNLNREVRFEIDTDFFQQNGNLDLYQGEFLTGFALKDSYEYDEWMNRIRSRFADLYLQRLFSRFHELPAEDVAGREALFHRYTATDPLDERIYLQMIQTYRENGQLLKGIRCYEELFSLLKEELGISPSQDVKALYHEMIRDWSSSEQSGSGGPKPYLLIGREKELSALRKSWQMLQLHQGSTIFLSGEKGIGKTWLCECFLQDILPDEALVLRADCFEQEKGIPLRTWNAILLQIHHILQNKELKVPPRCREVIASCFPVLDSLQKLDTPLLEFHASYNYRAVLNSIQQLLTLIGETIPVVLYINDLTNMDPLSAGWLSTIIRQNRGNLFILITCPSHMDSWWEKYVGDLVCLRNVRKIILHALEREDVRLFLSEQLPDTAVTPALVESVFKESRGNPFFLSVIADHLNAPGGGADVSRAEDILRSRLASLSRDERRLLDLVSLSREDTTADSLAFITGIDPLDLADLLEILVKQEFLTEEERDGTDRFRFRHQKMEEYVRGQLPPSKTHIYHRRIAEYLEREPLPKNSWWYTQLIWHWKESGSPAKSLYYRILQLEAYSNLNYDLYPVLSSPVEPPEHPQAEDISPELLPELAAMEQELSRFYTLYPEQIPYEEALCRLSLIIARVAISQGNYETGLDALRRQQSCSTYLRDQPSMARDYERQFIFYGIQTWNLPVMSKALEACLKIDHMTGETHELAIDHRLEGLYRNMKGEYEESDRLLNQAISEFRASPLALRSYSMNLAACYNYLGENARKRGLYEKAHGYFQKALSLCRENHQMENPSFYVNLSRACITLGQFPAALSAIQKARLLFEASNVQMNRSLCHICESYIEYRLGHFPESRKALAAAARTYRLLSSPRDAVYFYTAAFFLLHGAGEEYADLLTESPDTYRERALRILEDYPCIFPESTLRNFA